MRGKSDQPTPRPGWVARILGQVREALSVYRGLSRSLRLVMGAAPRHIVIMLPVYALFRLIEPATVWFSKFLVEALTDNRPLTALVIAGGYVLLRIVVEVATWIFELVVGSQRERLRYSLQSQLMHKATTMPDLALFESAGFYDKLQTARRSIGSAEELIVQVVNGFSVVLVLATLLGSLVLLHPVAALVVCIATVPMYLGQIRYAEGYSWVFREQAPQTRRLDYYFQLLTTDSAAKEIRLFDLGGYIIGLYRRTYRRALAQVDAFRRRQVPVRILLGASSPLGAGLVLLFAVWQAGQGAISLGDVVLYIGAVFLAQNAVRDILRTASRMYAHQLQAANILEFLDLESPMQPVADGRKVPAPWQEGLELRNVTFRYSGTEQPVLRRVSLRIRPGETVALVGHNGAGKTTLVKLLCRLYDPTEGRILLDGHDLREYDLRDVRRHTTVIFQDYARYHFTAGENIGLAAVSRRDDGEAIAAAAAQSGANEVIGRLPRGYDTQLGREFEGGMELSIGEWQKVALARAFFREAQLQILDEPTAALDAQAEYDVYLRFRELTQGRTTLLISHRFSTVRMADRILVLDRGRLVEEGNHDALMARGGLYADLYEKQAARYR